MLTFLRQFFRDARNTGSIMPSSPALARTMVAGLGAGAPQRWLEVGPGTGPFTRALLATKRPGDRLVIVKLMCWGLYENRTRHDGTGNQV